MQRLQGTSPARLRADTASGHIRQATASCWYLDTDSDDARRHPGRDAPPRTAARRGGLPAGVRPHRHCLPEHGHCDRPGDHARCGGQRGHRAGSIPACVAAAGAAASTGQLPALAAANYPQPGARLATQPPASPTERRGGGSGNRNGRRPFALAGRTGPASRRRARRAGDHVHATERQPRDPAAVLPRGPALAAGGQPARAQRCGRA